MGRIADALKRAQEERARRRHEATAEDPATGRGASPDSPDDPIPGSEWAGPEAIVNAPPPPKPFPITAPPSMPENIAPELVVYHDPASRITEKYRSARTRLLTSNPTGGSRVFAVTSSLPREGKTVTVGNLGFALAELRHLRVAMIDLDFRERGLSRLFGMESQPGVAELLRGERRLADVCLPVVRENLWLLPSGDPQGVNPSELISGGKASALFRELNERFHYSLVDTPPVNTAADIGLIAPMCHSVIMVVRMNRTPEATLQRCITLLKANRVAITGCILAGCDEETLGHSEPHDYYEAVA